MNIFANKVERTKERIMNKRPNANVRGNERTKRLVMERKNHGTMEPWNYGTLEP